MRTIVVPALARAVAELGNVVLDPSAWPAEMEKIAAAVAAEGAALLGLNQHPVDIPRTPSVDEAFRAYFESGWHIKGLPQTRGMRLLAAGATTVIDQDVVSPEEVQKTAYYDFLRRHGVGWFGAVALWSGTEPWLLTIQRTSRQGPFEPDDKRVLAMLSPRLSEAATLSAAVGSIALASAGSALNAMRHAALALGRHAKVLDANSAAHAMFDRHIWVVDGCLRIADPQARARLDQAVEAMNASTDAPFSPDPIVVKRGEEPPVIARLLSIPPPARNPFLGARALLTLAPVEPRSGPSAVMLTRIFGLTPAEARLASMIAEGSTIETVAEELQISRETARTQLKAVFAKTSTHRQAELVALLSGIAL